MGWFNHQLLVGMFKTWGEITLPETKSSPLKMGRAPKGNVHLPTSNSSIFRGYVSFKENRCGSCMKYLRWDKATSFKEMILRQDILCKNKCLSQKKHRFLLFEYFWVFNESFIQDFPLYIASIKSVRVVTLNIQSHRNWGLLFGLHQKTYLKHQTSGGIWM